MPTEERWRATWTGLRLEPAAGLCAAVRAAWSEPHRAYHTLRHLAECFAALDSAPPLAAHPAEVEAALWFHDAIYDTRAADSEERSAEWARRALGDAGADAERCTRVADLVLATKHAAAGAPAGDTALLLDVDLSILAADRARFLEYESQIRQEYAWVPEAAFREARAGILERFLARPRIYATDVFRDRLEVRARANLAESLRGLRA